MTRLLSARRSAVHASAYASVVAVAGMAILASSVAANAAVLPNRVRSDARFTDHIQLPQGTSKLQNASQSLGPLSGDTTLGSMSLVLAPSAAQNAALDQLLADQANPASPRYRKWLTPQQFGQQFGISDDDLRVLESWLTSQGFQVQGVTPSRNRIDFSGTAATTASAFGTSFSRFERAGQKFFSNTTAPSVPSAFSGVIGGIQGLSSYRPQPHGKRRLMTDDEIKAKTSPDLTGTTTSGATIHLLVPYDLRQIYGANSLISSGYTGTGVTIGVIGQTAVDTTQLGYFQTLTGQTVKAPTLTLVPGTGASTTYPGDEGEAESDLEFSGGTAPGATLNYVYAGSNADVIIALEYAITQNIGSILTLSYGGCEAFSLNGTESIGNLEPFLRQASAQGQTFVNSSGDSGAAGCDLDAGGTAYDGAQVSYPASSPYATGVGGTTFNEGTGNFWSTTNNSQFGSALSYIPEMAWDDNLLAGANITGLSSGGGGASIVFGKPNWQVGTGVPADGARDVPDVAFSASATHDPYIECSNDTSLSGTNASGKAVTGQCTSTTLGSYVIGGTSLSTPSFAGMLALAEQANGGNRLGNINPILYALAAQGKGVFNDVTVGSNQVPCVSGTTGCVNGLVGFSAGTGYDQATGLGSVNMGAFSAALSAANAVSAKTPTVIVTLASASTSTDVFTIFVGSSTSTTVPTGNVNVTIDGGTATSVALVSGAGTYTLTVSGLSTGNHTLTAAYGGDGNYNAATGTVAFTAGVVATSFNLAATPSTVTSTSGSKATGSLSLSSTGYSGLVLYSIVPATTTSVAPGCFIGANGDLAYGKNTVVLDTSISAGSTVTAGFTYDPSVSDCNSLALNTGAGQRKNGIVLASAAHPASPVNNGRSGGDLPWTALACGGCLLGGLGLRRRKSITGTLGGGLLVIAFTIAIMGASGCGNGGTPLSNTPTTPTTSTPVTYNYVITATSYPAGAVTTSTKFTVVVQ